MALQVKRHFKCLQKSCFLPIMRSFRIPKRQFKCVRTSYFLPIMHSFRIANTLNRRHSSSTSSGNGEIHIPTNSTFTEPKDILQLNEYSILLHLLRETAINNIFDSIPMNCVDGKSVFDIAKETECNPDIVYRILRFISGYGYTKQISSSENTLSSKDNSFKNYYFCHTIQSRRLCKKKNDNVENYYHSLKYLSSKVYSLYHDYGKSLKTGKSCNTGDFFGPNGLLKKLDVEDDFSIMMVNLSNYVIDQFSDKYNFDNIRTVADIAGGMGHLLVSILSKHKNIKGYLYDLPPIIQHAKDVIPSLSKDSNQRIQYIEGNFLKENNINIGADLYILKWILHDWNDENCLKIVTNIYNDIKKHKKERQSKLVIVELVLPNKDDTKHWNTTNFYYSLDLQMLLINGGKERSSSEYDDLLTKVGFTLTESMSTDSGFSYLTYMIK